MDKLKTNSKASLVLNIFNSIAPFYDLINTIISVGLNKKMKLLAINQMDLVKGDRILDLCCGTGDIISIILDHHKFNLNIIGVDFSGKMLEIAQKRFVNNDNVTLIQADASKMPFDDDYFDHIIISFGLRNLEDISNNLKEINRVLKKGGSFVSLDFGKPLNYFFKSLFDFYFTHIVTMIGKMFNRHSEYDYLQASIKEYPAPLALLKIMEENGFSNTSNINAFLGFVAIQKGYK